MPAPLAALQRFVIVSRAHFLAGGMLHYGVGAAVVWYQSGSLSLPALAAGQAIVTLSQLMTHYLNEYWDQEVDALSRRTFFSGGSGAIQAQLVRAALVYRAGLACALAALGLTLAVCTAWNFLSAYTDLLPDRIWVFAVYCACIFPAQAWTYWRAR